MHVVSRWLVAAALLLPGLAVAQPTEEVCPMGRFLVTDGTALPTDTSVTPGVVEFSTDGGLVVSGCRADNTRIVAKTGTTRLISRLTTCVGGSPARVRATVDAADCTTLEGVLRAQGSPPARFTATLSTCGDARLDTGGGEECDTSATAGDADCPGRCTQCVCTASSGSTTTTTRASTTTSMPVTTTSGAGTTSTTSNATTSTTNGSSTTIQPTTSTLASTTSTLSTSSTTSTLASSTTLASTTTTTTTTTTLP